MLHRMLMGHAQRSCVAVHLNGEGAERDSRSTVRRRGRCAAMAWSRRTGDTRRACTNSVAHWGDRSAYHSAGSSAPWTHEQLSHMKRERPQPRLLLSKQEAATSLGMSVRHFERHVQAHVRCVRSGQLTLYHLRDLEQWAEDEATINGRAA
jgi:hypothetical protein